jgi:serine/threonine-protein kinase
VSDEDDDLWIYDRRRGTKTRLTAGGEDEFAPSWSHSGEHIAYTAGPYPSEFSVWIVAADGASPPERIGDGVGAIFSPEDRELVFGRFDDPQGLPTGVRMTLDGDRRVETLPGNLQNLVFPEISPDGRYIAYATDDTGRPEVYIKRYPDMTGRWQVSTGGGMFPHWNQEGDEIYYAQDNDIMVVEVTPGDPLGLGTPQKLFPREPVGACPLPNRWPPGFDVTPDGELFLVFQPVESEPTPLRIEVVQNWYEEFRGEDQ